MYLCQLKIRDIFRIVFKKGIKNLTMTQRYFGIFQGYFEGGNVDILRIPSLYFAVQVIFLIIQNETYSLLSKNIKRR